MMTPTIRHKADGDLIAMLYGKILKIPLLALGRLATELSEISAEVSVKVTIINSMNSVVLEKLYGILQHRQHMLSETESWKICVGSGAILQLELASSVIADARTLVRRSHSAISKVFEHHAPNGGENDGLLQIVKKTDVFVQDISCYIEKVKIILEIADEEISNLQIALLKYEASKAAAYAKDRNQRSELRISRTNGRTTP